MRPYHAGGNSLGVALVEADEELERLAPGRRLGFLLGRRLDLLVNGAAASGGHPTEGDGNFGHSQNPEPFDNLTTNPIR